MVWKSTQLTSNAFEDYMTCLLWQDFEPHFPVGLRGQWHPSGAGYCLRGWPHAAQSIEGLTCLKILSLISGSHFHIAPQTGPIKKGSQGYQEKNHGVRICNLRALLCSPVPSYMPHARPLTLLNWFLLCHIGIISSGLPFRKGCEFYARCLRESILYASQMQEINIWISGLKPSFLRWAAFDICLLIQCCFTFLLLSKLFLFVWWMMKAFIPYNDNKHYLFSTYYLARSCSVYFIYIISFQFSEESFEACIVPHSTVDKAELRKAVVKGPEFTLGSAWFQSPC